MRAVLLVILVMLILLGLPQIGLHSVGYWPSGAGVVLLIVLLVLLLR